MIPIYICDDDTAMLRHMQKEMADAILIEGHDMQTALATPDPAALLAAVQAGGQRGVYFLDVDLKNEQYNGFTLAQQIRGLDPRGFIVFVTTHGELALETFRYKLEAMDYIEKDDTNALPGRVRACLGEVERRLLQEKQNTGGMFTLRMFDEVRHLPLGSILYFETSQTKPHNIVLYADNTILEYPGKLSEVEQTVGDAFWRCHRSCLVNRARIARVLPKQMLVELDSGETCPLSRKAKKEM